MIGGRANLRLAIRQDLEATTEPGVWRASGDDPQFQLEPVAGQRPLGPGWIRVEARGEALDGTFRPQLFWDDGTGYSEQRSLRLSAESGGRMEAVFVLSSPAVAWRLDPMESAGSFRLEWVRLEPLSRFSVLRSVLQRSLTGALRDPARAIQLVREAGALVLLDGPSALRPVIRAAALGQKRTGEGGATAPIASLKRGEQQVVAVGLIEHFGDIVACEPVARHLKATFPHARLAWVVRSRYRELIDSNPHIDDTIVVECLTDWIKLVRHGAFDKTVDLHVNHRVCSQCDIPLVKEHGDPDVTVDNYYDHGSLLTAFCKGAGLPALTDGPQVYISAQVVSAVDRLQLPARFVVVNCRSNEPSRDWSASKWRDLVERLRREGHTGIVEVGLEPIIGNVPGVVDATGRLSLLETAELIRRAELFVGIDSGPAHLANAVGTPGVVLLGVYRRFKKYLPFSGGYADGTNATMVYNASGPASELPVEDVVTATLARIHTARA